MENKETLIFQTSLFDDENSEKEFLKKEWKKRRKAEIEAYENELESLSLKRYLEQRPSIFDDICEIESAVHVLTYEELDEGTKFILKGEKENGK